MARQPPDQLGAGPGKDGGFPRAYGHAVHQNLGIGYGFDDLDRQVPGPYRAAPRHSNHVARLQTGDEFFSQRVEVVLDDSEWLGESMGQKGECRRGIAVGVAQLADGRRRIDGHQLIAGRNDPHPGPAIYCHVRAPHQRQKPQFLRAQDKPLFDDPFPCLQIFSPLHHVFTGGHGAIDLNRMLIHDLRMLHHYHGIGSCGEHPAGGDLYRRAGLYRQRGLFAHQDLPRHIQEPGASLGGPEGVFRPHGVAIHGRAIARGLVFLNADISCQDPAQGIFQPDVLRPQRCKPPDDLLYLPDGFDLKEFHSLFLIEEDHAITCRNLSALDHRAESSLAADDIRSSRCFWLLFADVADQDLGLPDPQPAPDLQFF